MLVLRVPADDRAPVGLARVTASAVAFSDALGGGFLDDVLDGCVDGDPYVVLLDEHRVAKGLPGDQRAADVPAARESTSGPVRVRGGRPRAGQKARARPPGSGVAEPWQPGRWWTDRRRGGDTTGNPPKLAWSGWGGPGGFERGSRLAVTSGWKRVGPGRAAGLTGGSGQSHPTPIVMAVPSARGRTRASSSRTPPSGSLIAVAESSAGHSANGTAESEGTRSPDMTLGLTSPPPTAGAGPIGPPSARRVRRGRTGPAAGTGAATVAGPGTGGEPCAETGQRPGHPSPSQRDGSRRPKR